jgi:hypothetical protein
MALQSFVGLWPLFSFLIFYTVVWTPWTGDQPVVRPLPTHRQAQTQNKCTQTSMPQVEFEPTIPGIERVKTIHALDRAATVIGDHYIWCRRNSRTQFQTKERCMNNHYIWYGGNSTTSFLNTQSLLHNHYAWCGGNARQRSNGYITITPTYLSIYCSHLEHRAFVKRFVSLQFINLSSR